MSADDGVRGDPAEAPSRDDLVTFHVNGLPLALQARAQEHADELTRELTLVGAALRQGTNTRDLPARLVDLIEQLSAQYSMFTVEQEKRIADAIAHGHDTIDLTYRLPATVGAAAQALGDILDEADDYCRAGRLLLTLATPADLVAYRRWFLSQFTAQIAGQSPVTWDDYLRRHAT
jgi:hypothetical protein